MFENCLNSKRQGNIGIAHAILYFTTKGYIVSVPLNDSQDYDLIVDKEETLYKVQVKTSYQISKDGNPIASLRSCGGTKGSSYGNVNTGSSHLLYILHNNGTSWLIPVSKELPSTSITLGEKYKQYIVE